MNLQNLVDYCEEMGLPDIFSGASVPAPLNIDTVISAIMVRCGLLTPLYGEPDTFRNMTTHWFTTKQWTFEHLIAVIQSEYSPIENVFEVRKEITTYDSSNVLSGGHKDVNSGKDTVTHSEKDTTERTYDEYKETDKRSYSNDYKDTTERSFTNYKEDTTHDYDVDDQSPYTEVTKIKGASVKESQVSAFNASTYQPSTKDGEKYGVDMSGAADPRQDEKSVSGKYKDSKATTGSYKDENTIVGTHQDDKTIEGSYKDETTFGHKITTDNGLTTTRTYQQETDKHTGKDTFDVTRHGNVGTVSSMHLIEEELALLRHFDIYGYIAELFESDNMLMIY